MKDFQNSRRQKKIRDDLILVFFFYAVIITAGLARLESVLRAVAS